MSTQAFREFIKDLTEEKMDDLLGQLRAKKKFDGKLTMLLANIGDAMSNKDTESEHYIEHLSPMHMAIGLIEMSCVVFEGCMENGEMPEDMRGDLFEVFVKKFAKSLRLRVEATHVDLSEVPDKAEQH